MSEISTKTTLYDQEMAREKEFLRQKGVCPDCCGTGQIRIGCSFDRPMLVNCSTCKGKGELAPNLTEEGDLP